MGWGIGGNVLLPVIPKYLDLQGSVLTGQGIGRYGSSQLPDVEVGPTGALKTIQATHFLVGAVAHPFAGNDFYAYYGQEQNGANAWTVMVRPKAAWVIRRTPITSALFSWVLLQVLAAVHLTKLA